MIAEKLRKSILQAAIQGKLTEQIPEDGDAINLLEEIKTEKARLMKEGTIKKETPLPEIAKDEIPFEIPESWCWVRLGEVCTIVRGASPRPKGDPRYFSQKVTDYHWIKISDITKYCQNDRLINTEEYLTVEGSKLSVSVDHRDIIVAASGSVGKSALLDICGYIYDGLMAIKDIPEGLSKKYLVLYLKFIEIQLLNIATGTSWKNITTNILKNLEVPLPPLAEQQRVVKAIEKAFTTIKDLEKDELKLNLLQKSFPKKMKNSLLQAAIQGKLTEQLESDGNASDLVAEIQKENEQFIKEDKIKKEKTLPEITENEIPFDIPDNWCWVRLGDICTKIGSGNTPSGGKAVYVSEGVKFIRSQNVYNDGLRLENVAFISPGIDQKKAGSHVYAKDILLNITGASIGRCSLVPDDFDMANINQHVLILRLSYEEIRKYIHLVMISPYIYGEIMNVQVGGTKEGLSASKAKQLLIPLPPHSEQQRIVERLEQLLPLCDTLE